jgi:glutamine amidotransferase-like uncharacterized protein
MRKYTVLFIILLGLGSHILFGNDARAADVILFDIEEFANYQDIASYSDIARELNLSTQIVDYRFINEKASFFDKDGHRKFRVLILPGGEPYRWFEKKEGRGITCQGVDNILRFIESGGSVISICICGSSLFAAYEEWINPTVEQAQRGMWDKTGRWPGAFKKFCGVYAFNGTLRGPQETNRPYPKTRFLPIKMNPENEIVREAKLPPVIYQIVVGGGSILPDEGQPLDVVGWFPNGTAAIGIVPYGKGRIIMSNPHPNITGERAQEWVSGVILSRHARRYGWTEKMIADGLKLIKTEGDPDGPEPDWALAKAMLSYAFKKSSE